VPAVPGIPDLGADEAAQIPTGGSKLRIALGELRQVTSGHAVAARATAIKILLTQGKSAKNGQSTSSAVILDLEVGRLEAAAVAPGALGSGNAPGPGSTIGPGNTAGSHSAGWDLPITGPQVTYLLITALALLALGAAAIAGTRTRPVAGGPIAPCGQTPRNISPPRTEIGRTETSEPPID
jgi:hypothetical protein